MKTRPFLLTTFCALHFASLGFAQQPKPAPAAGGFRITAARQIIRPNGMRLEGSATQPARIQSPQLDVSAQILAFDYAGNAITQVRAQNGVNFKLNLDDQVVNGQKQRVQIEARADSAVLDATPKGGRRTLKLNGKVNGWYQVGEARNVLNGQSAVISFGSGVERALDVQLEGGAEGVRLEVDGAAFGADVPLETLIVTASRASIDQKTNTAKLTGNARAVTRSRAEKNQGAQTLDVSAPEFELKLGARGAKGGANGAGAAALQSLQTRGRTKIVVDIAPAPNAAPNPNPDQKASLSPTHLEVSADSATVEPNTQRILLQGNVSGFYLVPTKDANGKTTDNLFPFSGDRATARFVPKTEATTEVPAGLNLEVTQVSIEVPGFDLGLD